MKSTNENFKPVKIEIDDNYIQEKSNSISKIKNLINSSYLKILFFNKNIYETINQDKIKCLKPINKYFHHILCFILFLISITFYYKSLESCGTISPNLCSLTHKKGWYSKLIRYDIYSSIFFGTFISIILFRCKGYIHFLYSIPIFFYYFKRYQGSDADDHGLYNIIGFTITLIIYIPLSLFVLYILYFLYKKQIKKFLIILIIFVLLFYKSYKVVYPNTTCNPNWPYGLNNTKIDNNNKYPCKIQIPKVCGVEAYNWLDVTSVFRPNCQIKSLRKIEKQRFFETNKNSKFINNKYNHFGYPITTNDKFNIEKKPIDNRNMSVKYFYSLIHNNTIVMDKFNEINYPNTEYPEIELTFDENNYGKITQRINYNETLSKERKKLAENKKSLFNNILVIYEDTISRKEFLRKLPKTSKLIEKYMKYSKNITEKPITSFQFLKYHNIDKFTLLNSVAMFHGASRQRNEIRQSFIKQYKESGFITGQSITWCSRETYDPGDYRRGLNNYIGYDHENNALFCDSNYGEPSYSVIHGINSILKRCLYGKEGYLYAMEYAELFWNAYKDNKKFFRLMLIEAHEFTMNLVMHLDNDLYNFLLKFINNGNFDDTAIVFVSDHGNNFGTFIKMMALEDRVVEGFLGTFFIMMTNKKEIYDSGIYDNLIHNAQTFFTPYDIYNTLVHFAIGNFEDIDTKGNLFNYDYSIYSKKGESLLNNLDYTKRSCNMSSFGFIIDKYQCKCK